MRTKVIAFLMLLICLTGHSRFRYGMTGNMNLGYLGFGGSELTDHRSIARFGFSFGFAGEIGLSERFFLQPELNLDRKSVV